MSLAICRAHSLCCSCSLESYAAYQFDRRQYVMVVTLTSEEVGKSCRLEELMPSNFSAELAQIVDTNGSGIHFSGCVQAPFVR